MRAVDPFRSALSNAVLWSSNLQTRLDARVTAALADAASALGFGSTAASTAPPSGSGSPPGEALAQSVRVTDTTLAQGVADADTALPPASDDSVPPASGDPAPPASDDSAPAVTSDRPPPPREQTADAASDDSPPPFASSRASNGPTLTPGRADRLLRERCPACFGLQTWGRPLQE